MTSFLENLKPYNRLLTSIELLRQFNTLLTTTESYQKFSCKFNKRSNLSTVYFKGYVKSKELNPLFKNCNFNL